MFETVYIVTYKIKNTTNNKGFITGCVAFNSGLFFVIYSVAFSFQFDQPTGTFFPKVKNKQLI